MKKIIQTKNAPAAIGPYSQGVMVDGGKNIYFFSGQIPLDPATGNLVGSSIEEQTRQVIKNLQGLLAEVGAISEDVLKTTIFLKSMNDFAKVNEIYGGFFTKNPPARSTVEVARLPKDALIEIEMIVAK